MNYSNGNSFSNGNSMCLDSGSNCGHALDGSRPPSWWFTSPADPVWRI